MTLRSRLFAIRSENRQRVVVEGADVHSGYGPYVAVDSILLRTN